MIDIMMEPTGEFGMFCDLDSRHASEYWSRHSA